MRLAYVATFSLLGSIGALAGAGLLLAFPVLRERHRSSLIAYAIGTLLGAVFLSLLPEAIDALGVRAGLLVTFAGFIAFFLLEKVLSLYHLHASENSRTRTIHPVAPLILIGDGIHNFVDGVLIAAAFSVSVPLGIITALAVVAHEIPQELGDFVILLEAGMGRWRAYWLNFLVALATPIAALLTYVYGERIAPLVPYALAASAANFLYVAVVDLAPILHHVSGRRTGAGQAAKILAGVSTIAALRLLLG